MTETDTHRFETRGTYETLDERREVLSPAVERFESARRTIGLAAGPLLAVLVYVITPGLEPAERMLAAVLTFIVAWWLTEAVPIPVTAVLGLTLCVALGVAPADDVFRASQRSARRRLRSSSAAS